MGKNTQIMPLPDNDAEIVTHLAEAELLALVSTVAHLTGDLSLLDPRLIPDVLKLRDPQSGYDDDQQTLAREIILRGLRKFRDEQQQIPAPSCSSSLPNQ